MFDPGKLEAGTIAAIKAAAVAAYPNEMCGAIDAQHRFRELANVAPEPARNFDCTVSAGAMMEAGDLVALVHSHPDGPDAPSAQDIATQRRMGVPWGLVSCNGLGAIEPWWWGDQLEPPPLEGRMFRHGPSGTDGRGDCGALIRDWFRLERGVLLPDFPREDGWWLKGEDLYEQHFAAAGFVPVDVADIEPGDVALFAYRSPVPNHGAIYLGHGIILHHLGGRCSVRESVLGYQRLLRRVLRHAG